MMLSSKFLMIFGLLGFVGVSLGQLQPLLGRGIFIPRTDLLGTISEESYATAPVFDPISPSCFHEQPIGQSSRYFSYYEDTASFYSSVSTSTGMTASFEADFSLQTTLKVQSTGISGSEKKVSGNELVIVAKSKSFQVDKACLVNDPSFTSYFRHDLNGLPTKVPTPWNRNSWAVYDSFLQKYGSHILTQITTGSEIDQRSFSKQYQSYSERDFEVKSCIGLSSPGTDATQMGVSLCTNVTNEEIQRVNNLEMTTKLTVNGGTEGTRNQLINYRSQELIEQFMNEANVSNSPIRYKLTPVWDILKQSFIGVSDDFVRGVNMEAYYLGYMSYGCDYQQSGGQDLQRFNFTEASSPESPQYECTLAPTGCKGKDDCHYHPIWCSCEGNSCVHYKDTVLDTGKVKTTAYINHEPWGWQGCDWQVAGSYCNCYNSNTERKKVWPVDTSHHELAYKAHNDGKRLRSIIRSKSGREEL